MIHFPQVWKIRYQWRQMEQNFLGKKKKIWDMFSIERGKGQGARLFYLVELTKSCMWLYSACWWVFAGKWFGWVMWTGPKVMQLISCLCHCMPFQETQRPIPLLVYTLRYTRFLICQCTEFFNGHVMFLSQIYLSLKCFLVKKLGLKIILLSFWVFRISFVAAL